MTRKDRVAIVENTLQEEYREGRLDGLSSGHEVAQRIFFWWFTNNQLPKPHSHETLEQWSRNALAELKKKLSS